MMAVRQEAVKLNRGRKNSASGQNKILKLRGENATTFNFKFSGNNASRGRITIYEILAILSGHQRNLHGLPPGRFKPGLWTLEPRAA